MKVYGLGENRLRHAEVGTVARTLSPDAPGVEAVLRNAGAVPIVAKGRFEYRSLGNAPAAVVETPELPLLPGSSRRVRIADPELAPGDYVVLALFDYGGDTVAAGQLVVTQR